MLRTAQTTILAKANKVANSHAFARIYDACLQGIAETYDCSLTAVADGCCYCYCYCTYIHTYDTYHIIALRKLSTYFVPSNAKPLLLRSSCAALLRCLASLCFVVRPWQAGKLPTSVLFVILLHWIKLNGRTVECQKWFRMRIRQHWTDQCERWWTAWLTGWAGERGVGCGGREVECADVCAATGEKVRFYTRIISLCGV